MLQLMFAFLIAVDFKDSSSVLYLLGSFGVAAICWFILAVELTLYWNSIKKIYDIRSTGRLIPFIVGLLGLIRVTHLAIMSRLESVSLQSLSLEFAGTH